MEPTISAAKIDSDKKIIFVGWAVQDRYKSVFEAMYHDRDDFMDVTTRHVVTIEVYLIPMEDSVYQHLHQ